MEIYEVVAWALVFFLILLIIRLLYWGLRPWKFRMLKRTGTDIWVLQVKGYWFGWIENIRENYDGDIRIDAIDCGVYGSKERLLKVIDKYYEHVNTPEYDEIYYPGKHAKKKDDLMLMELGKACASGDEQLVELILNKMNQ